MDGEGPYKSARFWISVVCSFPNDVLFPQFAIVYA